MKLLVTVPWDAAMLEGVRSGYPQVDFHTALATSDIIAAVQDAEIVFGDLNREAYLAARKLRWIQCHGAGVNKLAAIPELMASDVQITSTKGAHAATIAEHFFGILISLTRQLPRLYQAQLRRQWVKWEQWAETIGAAPLGLQGLTLGVIGLGNIGLAIAERARAFGMTVIAVDLRAVPKPDCVSALWMSSGLGDLLRQSDVVVVTVPGTPETNGLLGTETLGLMKPGAYLAAVSRGGIVDEAEVAAMLHDGRLAGAALDVTDIEPLPAASPLWTAPNLILTPHVAGKSANTTAAATEILRDNLARYLAGQPLRNLVDKRLGF